MDETDRRSRWGWQEEADGVLHGVPVVLEVVSVPVLVV